VGSTLELTTDNIIDLSVVGRYTINNETRYDEITGKWYLDTSEVFDGHNYQVTPDDTGTYTYIVSYNDGQLADTVVVHIGPGSPKNIKLSLVNPDDTIRAGEPFDVKIEAFDNLGIKTTDFSPDDIKLHTDISINDANAHFGYVNYALNDTDSVAISTNYGDDLLINTTSGEDIFQIVIVNSASKRQYITAWDSSVTNDSDRIAIDIYPSGYWQMIIVDPFALYFRPLGKARCAVRDLNCQGVDTIWLGIDAGTCPKCVDDITLASVAIDSFGNELLENVPPGGVESRWGVNSDTLVENLGPLSGDEYTDMHQVFAEGRDNSKGNVFAVCTLFNDSSTAPRNRDSVYIIINNPAFLDTLYYMDSLFSGAWDDTNTAGSNGYIDLVEIVFNGFIMFNFPKSSVNEYVKLQNPSTREYWEVIDILYKDMVSGRWESVWSQSPDSSDIKRNYFRIQIRESTGGPLQTILQKDVTIKILFERVSEAVFARTFLTTRCYYMDRAAPVLKKIDFSGNICDPSNIYTLSITFSEDLNYPSGVVSDLFDSLGSWDLVLREMFIVNIKDSIAITNSVFNSTSMRVIDVVFTRPSEVKLTLNHQFPYNPNEFLAYSFRIKGNGRISDVIRPLVMNRVETDFNRPVSVTMGEKPKACALTSELNTPSDDPSSMQDIKRFRYLVSIWTPATFPDSNCKETVEGNNYIVETHARIFDLLGNLVCRIDTMQKINTGDPNLIALASNDPAGGQARSIMFNWDWRNEKGRLVAAGGYLVVVTSLTKDMCDNLLEGGKTEFPPYKLIVPSHRGAK
jgi:hypothetical protein